MMTIVGTKEGRRIKITPRLIAKLILTIWTRLVTQSRLRKEFV